MKEYSSVRNDAHVFQQTNTWRNYIGSTFCASIASVSYAFAHPGILNTDADNMHRMLLGRAELEIHILNNRRKFDLVTANI